jgi:hypothetical protein
MNRVVRNLIIPAFAALLLTGATFLVTEDTSAQVPGSNGAFSGATARGFPMPYLLTFCCGIANGVDLLPSRSFYNDANLVSDLAVWLTISLSCTLVFSGRRLLIAASVGAAFTLATLVLRPLSSVSPGYGAETEALRPMGFPYEYLTYYRTGLPGATFSGYEFNLSAVLADYALWTGIALVGLGIIAATTMRRRRRGEKHV